VVGVFIGIQVANWNASQVARREEAAILQRLQSDFERIEQDADRSLEFHVTITEDLRTMLQSLRSGELKDDDIPAFEQALVLGPAFQTSADRSGTFTELMSSGHGNILRDRYTLRTVAVLTGASGTAFVRPILKRSILGSRISRRFAKISIRLESS